MPRMLHGRQVQQREYFSNICKVRMCAALQSHTVKTTYPLHLGLVIIMAKAHAELFAAVLFVINLYKIIGIAAYAVRTD